VSSSQPKQSSIACVWWPLLVAFNLCASFVGSVLYISCLHILLDFAYVDIECSTPTCPTCRQEWEYGAEKAVDEDAADNS